MSSFSLSVLMKKESSTYAAAERVNEPSSHQRKRRSHFANEVVTFLKLMFLSSN